MYMDCVDRNVAIRVHRTTDTQQTEEADIQDGAGEPDRTDQAQLSVNYRVSSYI